MYSELNPGSERYAELGTLEEKNLLEFARQIAAGMVPKNLRIMSLVLKARHLSSSDVCRDQACLSRQWDDSP